MGKCNCCRWGEVIDVDQIACKLWDYTRKGEGRSWLSLQRRKCCEMSGIFLFLGVFLVFGSLLGCKAEKVVDLEPGEGRIGFCQAFDWDLYPRRIEKLEKGVRVLDVGSFLLLSKFSAERVFHEELEGSTAFPDWGIELFGSGFHYKPSLYGLRLGLKRNLSGRVTGYDFHGLKRGDFHNLECLVIPVADFMGSLALKDLNRALLRSVDFSRVMVVVESVEGVPPFPVLPESVKFLCVRGTFGDYSALRNLRGLEYFSCQDESGGFDLTSLSAPEKLRFLELQNVILGSWDGLSRMKKLESLYLQGVEGPLGIDEGLEERPVVSDLESLKKLRIFWSSQVPSFQGRFPSLEEGMVVCASGRILGFLPEMCPKLNKLVLINVSSGMVQWGSIFLNKKHPPRVIRSLKEYFLAELRNADRLVLKVRDFSSSRRFVRFRLGGMKTSSNGTAVVKIESAEKVREVLLGFDFEKPSKCGSRWKVLGRGGWSHFATFFFYRGGKVVSRLWLSETCDVGWDHFPVKLRITEGSYHKIVRALAKKIRSRE